MNLQAGGALAAAALFIAFAATAFLFGCGPADTPIDPTATVRPTVLPPTVATSAMPVGNLPGWNQIFADDFLIPAPVGSFPGTAYPLWKLASGTAKGSYPDGWHDTTGNGTYYPSKVLSVHDGVLDYHLRTEAGLHLVAAPVPQVFQLYGRYSVRFRADPVEGYKTAWLLWPMSGVSPADGEIDFPEGNLNSTIAAFAHYANPSGGQDAFHTDDVYTDWQVATTEWGPGKIVILLNDVVVGTSTTQVPSKPMKWVLQTESWLSGTPPPDAAQGHVLIDWAVAYSYAPPASPGR